MRETDLAKTKQDDKNKPNLGQAGAGGALGKHELLVRDDPVANKIIVIFLIILLLALIFIPSEWFLKASMWWNGIK